LNAFNTIKFLKNLAIEAAGELLKAGWKKLTEKIKSKNL